MCICTIVPSHLKNNSSTLHVIVNFSGTSRFHFRLVEILLKWLSWHEQGWRTKCQWVDSWAVWHIQGWSGTNYKDTLHDTHDTFWKPEDAGTWAYARKECIDVLPCQLRSLKNFFRETGEKLAVVPDKSEISKLSGLWAHFSTNRYRELVLSKAEKVHPYKRENTERKIWESVASGTKNNTRFSKLKFLAMGNPQGPLTGSKGHRGQWESKKSQLSRGPALQVDYRKLWNHWPVFNLADVLQSNLLVREWRVDPTTRGIGRVHIQRNNIIIEIMVELAMELTLDW